MPPIAKVKTAAELHSPQCCALTCHHSSLVHLTIRSISEEGKRLETNSTQQTWRGREHACQGTRNGGRRNKLWIYRRETWRRVEDMSSAAGSLQKKTGQIWSEHWVTTGRELWVNGLEKWPWMHVEANCPFRMPTSRIRLYDHNMLYYCMVHRIRVGAYTSKPYGKTYMTGQFGIRYQ
jgi:hypothetical protein